MWGLKDRFVNYSRKRNKMNLKFLKALFNLTALALLCSTAWGQADCFT